MRGVTALNTKLQERKFPTVVRLYGGLGGQWPTSSSAKVPQWERLSVCLCLKLTRIIVADCSEATINNDFLCISVTSQMFQSKDYSIVEVDVIEKTVLLDEKKDTMIIKHQRRDIFETK